MESSLKTRSNNTPERNLWRAVLATAADDAINESEIDVIRNAFRTSIHIKTDQDYFLNPTRHFYTVCQYAGYDPEYIKRKMRQAIERRKKYVRENDMSRLPRERLSEKTSG